MIVSHPQSVICTGKQFEFMHIEGRISTRKIPTLYHVVPVIQNNILALHKAAIVNMAPMILTAIREVRFSVVHHGVEVVRVPKVAPVCEFMTVPNQVL